jgi:hypothetical protein
MKASKGRDRTPRATVDSVSTKKKNPPPEPIPAVNEAEFTEVVRRMVNTSPVTREDVEQKGFKRKRNPETDPRKLTLLFPGMPSQKKR